MDAYFESGGSGAWSFQPKFPEILVQNSIHRFGPTWKVSNNGPLRKQRVMVWDLWQVDFYQFSVFQGLLLLNFRVRSRVFEIAVSFTLAQFFFYLLYTETWQVYIPKVKLFLKSFQIQKKQRYGRVKTNRYVPANIHFSLILIYRRCTCDVAAGTAWDTSRTNENMHCRQWLEPSQSFTAGMHENLNSGQLCRYVGGKYWDDQCCLPLLFSYRNSIPGTTGGHVTGASVAYENQAKHESNELSNQRRNLLFYPRRNIQRIQWAFYLSDNIIDNTINTEPDLTSLVDFVNRKKAGNSGDFSIPTISEREVLEIIKSLPSTGLDGISSPLLKLIALAVAPSLAKVINCSIINSICPAQLKLARVTPIRFTNRGVKPILTITDLYQSSLSFRRFSRNLSANTSHCFSHQSRFTVQMPIGF